MTQTADVCFVSTASNPIGSAMVKVFANHGYLVGFLAESQDAVSALESAVQGCQGVVARDLAEIPTLLGQLVQRVGVPRVLVTCDEEFMQAGLDDTSPDKVDAVAKKTLVPRMEVIRVLVPYLSSSGQGRIINIIHRDWLGWQHVAAYSALNGAVLSLTRSLAWELAKRRVTVNAVVAGVVVTEGDGEFHGKPVEKWLSTQPIRRIGRPEDVAEAAAFLASPRSGFISGQALYVDGGRCIFSSLTA